MARKRDEIMKLTSASSQEVIVGLLIVLDMWKSHYSELPETLRNPSTFSARGMANRTMATN